MPNTLSNPLYIYTHEFISHPSAVTQFILRSSDQDIRYAGGLGISYDYDNCVTSIEYYMEHFAALPENLPLTTYIQTHYSEYLI